VPHSRWSLDLKSSPSRHEAEQRHMHQHGPSSSSTDSRHPPVDAALLLTLSSFSPLFLLPLGFRLSIYANTPPTFPLFASQRHIIHDPTHRPPVKLAVVVLFILLRLPYCGLYFGTPALLYTAKFGGLLRICVNPATPFENFLVPILYLHCYARFHFERPPPWPALRRS
jgi:hypothetical protein